MNSIETFIRLILPTAAVSSFLTGIILYFALKRYYRRILQPRLSELPREIGDKVESGVRKAAKDMMPEFEERVKKGLKNGVVDMTTLSPDFTSSIIQTSLESLGLFQDFGKSKRRKE